MPLHDPTPHKVSACPVHFIWDGVGHGRVLVRIGFLGFLLAAMLLLGGRLLHVEPMRAASVVIIAIAAAAWGAGHLLGLRTRKRPA